MTVIGFRTCKEWMDNRKKDLNAGPYEVPLESTFDQVWLQGFLSGINSGRTDKDALSAIDSDTMAAWMDRYCKNNPKSNIHDGGLRLYVDLLKLSREGAGHSNAEQSK